MSEKVFVSPTNDGWKVKRPEAKKAAGLFDNKTDAINRAIELSKKRHAELFVQNRNGRIGWKNSYGNDPRNIKG